MAAVKFELDFQGFAEYVKPLVIQEFRDQGHNLTGNLIKSIDHRVLQFGQGNVAFELLYAKYGIYVENGVASARIPFSGTRRSGQGTGGTSQYIEGLKRFVRLRRLTSGLEREVTSIAFAIAKSQKKTRMPTPASSRFSKSGRRTRFTSYPVEKNEGKILNQVNSLGHTAIVSAIDKAVQRILL